MSIKELIQNRRSVRRFKDEPVSDEEITELLEAARWAPSAGNQQPWHFYVVRDENLLEQLVDVAFGQSFLAEAPVAIVVCAEPERSARRYDDRGRQLYCLQDTGAAIQNMLLLAENMGLSSCWMGAFDEEQCSRVLSLPDERRPVAILPIGHADIDPKAPRRRPLEEITDYL